MEKRMYGLIYRIVMKIAHRYNWHYAPPIYPEGDVQLWCKWCGFRQTIKRGPKYNKRIHEDAQKDAHL
ncbi:MAG: hypothetical protein ABII13_04820 [Patescibacteria group bacterium]